MKREIQIRTLVALLGLSFVLGYSAKKEPKNLILKLELRPKLLVLDPVNLKNNRNEGKVAIRLRDIFKTSEKWNVLKEKDVQLKLLAYKKDKSRACKELACAHDLGDIARADYVLFSTVSKIGRMVMLNLNLLDVKATKIVGVASREFVQASYSVKSRLLHYNLKNAMHKINEAKEKEQVVAVKGSLGILQAQGNSQENKTIAERLFSHAYGTGLYDVIDQEELNYSYEALNLKTKIIKVDRASVTPVGKKLGLDYLLHSKLYKKKKIYFLELSLFDIKRMGEIKKEVFQSDNFLTILAKEARFFKELVIETNAPRANDFAKINR